MSGEEVETDIPLTSIKHARQVIVDVTGHSTSSIKLFTAEGEAINDDSPFPEDFSKISIAIVHWTGNAKLLGEYKHSTDAALSDKCIPVEVFMTAADPDGAQKTLILRRYTIENGQIDSLSLLRWILEVDLDGAYGHTSWKTGPYMFECMDINRPPTVRRPNGGDKESRPRW